MLSHNLNFPKGLWSNVLTDWFIDLDEVYYSYYTLEPDHRHTKLLETLTSCSHQAEVLGSPTRQSGHMENGPLLLPQQRQPSCMPLHQAKEFSQYEELIIGQISALNDICEHIKVINLDCAIRMHISRGNVLSLISYGSFTDLFT